MLINSRGSAFSLDFPKDFFPTEVSDWATPYIKRKPIAFQNFETYMSSCIQSVTFPSMSADTVSQQSFGKERRYRNARPTNDMYAQDITITMKLLSGAFNYFAWQRTFLVWHQLYSQDEASREVYFEPLNMRFLDEEGYVTQSVQIKQLTLTNISEITLDYTSNNPDFKTFNVTFNYNYLEFRTESD